MAIVKLRDTSMNVVERGSGVPLLLVHGYPLDYSMWQGQIDGLADKCHVIAPNCAGLVPAM